MVKYFSEVGNQKNMECQTFTGRWGNITRIIAGDIPNDVGS